MLKRSPRFPFATDCRCAIEHSLKAIYSDHLTEETRCPSSSLTRPQIRQFMQVGGKTPLLPRERLRWRRFLGLTRRSRLATGAAHKRPINLAAAAAPLTHFPLGNAFALETT